MPNTAPITATPIPMLSDNYAWLLRGPGGAAIVDPAEPADLAPYLKGETLAAIFITHHHADHIDGVEALRARHGAKVVGNARDADRLPRLDVRAEPGGRVSVAGFEADVIDTPGHTVGHIAYFFPDGAVLACGDTIFSLGCGRLFEGTAADLFGALTKFRALPPQTLICAGHEYTESNARYALSVDPGNAALQARAAEIATLRHAGKPTLPVSLGAELGVNPFLRARTAEELGRLRAGKDNFKG